MNESQSSLAPVATTRENILTYADRISTSNPREVRDKRRPIMSAMGTSDQNKVYRWLAGHHLPIGADLLRLKHFLLSQGLRDVTFERMDPTVFDAGELFVAGDLTKIQVEAALGYVDTSMTWRVMNWTKTNPSRDKVETLETACRYAKNAASRNEEPDELAAGA